MSTGHNAMSGVAVEQAVQPLEGHFDNVDFDWLTFESVGNKLRFRKSNQKRPLGFYILNLGAMQVWVREHISPGGLKI